MRADIIKKTAILFTALLVLCTFSDCGDSTKKQHAKQFQSYGITYQSFRDIPGISSTEIAAIEALQQQRTSFVYGTTPSTESFLVEGNEIEGFTSLFCDWLSSVFAIPFVPKIYSWGDLISGLENHTIDFTGELTATDERHKTYLMTDAIAERAIKYFRIANSTSLAEIAQSRPLHFVFLKGTTTVNAVLPTLTPGSYEASFIDNSSLAYDLLKAGKADAFINEGPGESAFDIYNDVVTSDFYPLIYEPVSMTTQNHALEPIISAVQKMLRSGGIRYLTELYNRGYQGYIKQKLFTWLNEEERAYIKNNPVIPVAADPGHYPVSFYNKRDKEWQGIFFDLLDEIALLSGLTFNCINDQYTEWPAIQEMLANGKAAFVPELIWSEERDGLFIWPETAMSTDYYTLISKMDHRNISINEILYVKVGLAKDTAYTTMFNYWFPNHLNTVEYESIEEAFNALRNDEVDMVMAALKRLMHLTNYEELPGYKANVIFDSSIEEKFGFNRDEVILCSIIDKALRLTDTKGISDQWMRKTYDYRLKVVQAQRPWFIGAASLFLCVVVLLFILFMRNKQEGRKLENLVTIRTSELKAVSKDLEIAAKTAEAASLSKSQFLANMSHEIRTPMNAILGITEILLRNETLNSDMKEPLNKIYNSGDLLLNIINDILDLSKIEAGKLEILPAKYEVASLINDTVTLNMMRIGSKPIEFKLSVDENIPTTLFGDELRIKQILNNILSNAFKYTEKGEVKLFASAESKSTDDNETDIMLVFRVSDTGQGMTEEQVSKLFDEYSRFNMDANRTTEGTGLGMSITQNLVRMMIGEIFVESEAKKGSTFTVRLPQQTTGSGVLGKELAENLQHFELAGEKQMRKTQIAYEPMPYGNILVVDDVESNLYVAQGLMSPYGLKIDTSVSGFEALEKISKGKVYDIIFMDHMMPKMDGIETTKRLRETGYTQPIIALTANAVIGQSDVFLKNGFDDFISKPIDTRQLNAMLKKYVRDKQPPEVLEAARQQPAGEATPQNRASVIPFTPRLAEVFVRDAVKAIAALEAIHANGVYGEDDVRSYTINVHGMKSALANIGESALSAIAAKLEQASRVKEIDAITVETPDFLNKLKALVEKLQTTQEASSSETPSAEITAADKDYLHEKLLAIKTACQTFERKVAKEAIAELREKEWPPDVKEVITTMAEHLLDGDFEALSNTAGELLRKT